MLAAAGLAGHLLGGGGQQPGLPFGLAGQGAGGPPGLQVEHRPQLAEPVQGVQAERVLLPAAAQRGREVAVAGPVDLLDPGAEPADGVVAGLAVEPPEPRRRGRLVGRVPRRRRARSRPAGRPGRRPARAQAGQDLGVVSEAVLHAVRQRGQRGDPLAVSAA